MKFLLSFLMTVILVAAGAVAFGVHLYKEPSKNTKPVEFLVEKGNGTRQIASALENKNLISNKWIFLVAAKLSGEKTTLKAGEYEIKAHATMAEILVQLAEGRIIQRKVTVPEGLTSYEIVTLLNETPNMGGTVTDIPQEGTLLPETYLYERNELRQNKIAEMQKSLQKVKVELWEKREKDLPIKTWEEALTIASIVEKETGVASERKAIAGVFINRLRKGIPLQSDPTVIYALTNGKPRNDGQGPLGRRLLAKDLGIDSPYNTYKYTGLPPGPIANPGREAIAAVLNPQSHNFFYFVADGSGGHVFAATLSEHNKNVAQWRQIRQKSE